MRQRAEEALENGDTCSNKGTDLWGHFCSPSFFSLWFALLKSRPPLSRFSDGDTQTKWPKPSSSRALLLSVRPNPSLPSPGYAPEGRKPLFATDSPSSDASKSQSSQDRPPYTPVGSDTQRRSPCLCRPVSTSSGRRASSNLILSPAANLADLTSPTRFAAVVAERIKQEEDKSWVDLSAATF